MRRALYVLAGVVIVALVIGLYKAKSDASKAASHVRQLETQIAETQADMRALRAEIARLENPERVEQLARQHTDLRMGRDGPEPRPEREIENALPAPRSAKQ